MARPSHETVGQEKAPQTRRRVSWLSALGAFVAVAAIAVLTVWLIEFEGSAAGLEERVQSWGTLAALASIGLMVLHSFVPFPAEMLAVANGMLFGPVWGTIVTWAGAMLGAYLAFGLARCLGRPFVESMVPERHWVTGLERTAGRHCPVPQPARSGHLVQPDQLRRRPDLDLVVDLHVGDRARHLAHHHGVGFHRRRAAAVFRRLRAAIGHAHPTQPHGHSRLLERGCPGPIPAAR